MDFSFNLNNLLPETITKLDSNVNPGRRNANGYDTAQLRNQLMSVIDKMGEASSRAQGLHNIITTGRKLQLSDHILYMMKDPAINGGKGSAVGILKIGRKKLFVYNHHGNVHEIEPLCVLDFYVHESRQRMGCGRKLFDFMLQDQGVKPQHLAIDKPSFKFSQFLNKHFHLRAEIPQVNNFVVFEGFFNNRPDSTMKMKSGGQGQGRPPAHPARRRENLVEDGFQRQNSYNGYGLPPVPPTINGAGQHDSRPGSGVSIKTRSASVLSTPRRENMDYQRHGQLRPISATEAQEVEQRRLSAQAVRTQGKQIYSRHINSESPVGSRPNSGNPRPPIPGISAGINIKNDSINQNQNAQLNDPPLLKRGVTTDEYLQNFNLHQEYQGRRGHMKVISAGEQALVPARNPFLTPEQQMLTNAEWQPPRDQGSWTVFNKPPGYLSIAKRNYTHTRLW